MPREINEGVTALREKGSKILTDDIVLLSGIHAADGTLNNHKTGKGRLYRITIIDADKESLNKVKEIVKRTFNFNIKIRKSIHENAYLIIIDNKPIIRIFNKLLNFIKHDRIDLYRPIYFMKRTGRRVEETTLIERRDVVWDGIKPIKINIRAETTKTDEYSPLGKLDSDLEVFISQAYRESFKHKAPYLFLTKRGKKFNQRRICEYLKDVSEKIIGIKITSHYFRHRYWVECGKSNVPIVDAMAISGNKDPDVVIAFYSHSTSEGLAKVLELTRILWYD